MFLQSLSLQNLLSFRDTQVELGPLTVLIGPNGSGKSNLIEAIGLLQAAPRDLNRAIIRGGGAAAWIWKGNGSATTAELECAFHFEGSVSPAYRLSFSSIEQALVVEEEELFGTPATKAGEKVSYVKRDRGEFRLCHFKEDAKSGQISSGESILAAYKNPADPTPITRLGRNLSAIRIYREFATGPYSQVRNGISSSVPKSHLEEDGSNLAAVLHELNFNDGLPRIREYLRQLSDRFEDVKTRLEAGVIQTYLKERGLSGNISALRLSDGTLKLLCLLAVLCNPDPLPMVCIEEPEAGLHPDALKIVATGLIEASRRMQIIVTTHSENLVDHLSDHPENVVVCERDGDEGTQFNRLSREKLGEWLEHYSLGELWKKGEIGGRRW